MSHTVITTSTTTARTSGSDGCLNMGYTRTIPGLLKIGQMLALLVTFLCVHCAYGWPSWAAFQYFEGKMPCINWPLTEFFHYALGTILVLIASIIGAVKASGVSALVVATVFGFIATFLMSVSLWTTYSVSCGSQPTGAAV
ncbi:CKLF-like MARVEL transmembrane domain-containing protein 7 isoform X2 [Synchiropus splendidus]|uniref:CKLF-like MARVEL transmembrane domain-containing protein 7 isoform X2 n=1 Tax=Synchiropus splendidus TaxID=270530 RepID=UPI00237E5E33|nr:CKLF-like MARVEL transmembrane domain-containing protein 7 isoform X2 [Synchiropus splendidus]